MAAAKIRRAGAERRADHLDEVGCGSSDVALRTTPELRGVALDRDKRPVAHVPIHAEVISYVAATPIQSPSRPKVTR